MKIAELPSSLELVQGVYDRLKNSGEPLEHPLPAGPLVEATKAIASTWTKKRGVEMQLSPEELAELVEDSDRHWSLENQKEFLKRLDAVYKPWRKVPKKKS